MKIDIEERLLPSLNYQYFSITKIVSTQTSAVVSAVGWKDKQLQYEITL